jgi:hypothetical protein
MADQAEAVTAPAVPTEAPTNDNSKPEAKPAADAPAEAIVSAQEADDSKKEAAEAEGKGSFASINSPLNVGYRRLLTTNCCSRQNKRQHCRTCNHHN